MYLIFLRLNLIRPEMKICHKINNGGLIHLTIRIVYIIFITGNVSKRGTGRPYLFFVYLDREDTCWNVVIFDLIGFRFVDINSSFLQ